MSTKFYSIVRSKIPSLVLIFVATLLLTGCAKKPDDTPAKSAQRAVVNRAKVQPADPTARQVADVYRLARQYHDQATMELSYVFEDGRREKSKTRYALRYAAPNRVHLDVANDDNRVLVISDGTQLVARIVDPMTADFDHQIVVRDAPEVIKIADVYMVTELVDPISPGEMLSALLGAPAGLELTPLSLLLNDGRLGEVLMNAKPVSPADGPAGYRLLESNVENGKFRFWIDATSSTIQRIEFPPTTTGLPAGIARVELVANFTKATFPTSLDEGSFKILRRAEDQEVTHFILPPVPLPTKRLGKPVADLAFVDAENRDTLVRTQSDHPQVLVWFHNHPASRMVLEQLESLRGRIEDKQIAFHFVCVEPASTNVQQLLSEWRIKGPGYTDRYATGRDKLGVNQTPTTLVIGADGKLHHAEVIPNPNVAEDVAIVLERLLAGDDVAKLTVERHQQASQQYDRQLKLAKTGDGWEQEPETQLAPASMPQQFDAEQLWSVNDVVEPGNMLLLPGKPPSFFVLEGWNRLLQFDLDGHIQKQIELELPVDQGVTLLRGGFDREGQPIIAAYARGASTAFVFDVRGKLLMQYPEQNHQNGIGDVVLTDLDQDQDPELCVGWQGESGVHGVGMDGKQRWVNRAMTGVTSLCSVGAVLLATGESGLVVHVDASGRTLRESSIGNQPVHALTAYPGHMGQFRTLVAEDAPFREKQSHFCALAFSTMSEPIALGANRGLDAVWQQPLTAGVFRHQVDNAVAVGRTPTSALWLIPGADGSISLVEADGNLRDRLCIGKHIRGLGAVNVAGEVVIIASTDHLLTAWKLSAK